MVFAKSSHTQLQFSLVRLNAVSMLLAGVCMLTSSPLHSQGFRDFSKHAAEMKAYQPGDWQVPLATTPATLSQLYRGEVGRPIMAGGIQTWNYGNGKGVYLILNKHFEFDTVLPNYASHNDGKQDDGFGDYSFTSKARLFSGNRNHGNYAVSSTMQQTFSTGLLKNGAVSATRVYTLAAGKGYGNFNVQSSAGVTIPAAAGLTSIGHPVSWNTSFQDRAAKHLWVAIEDNLTVYNGGTHDGKKQNFMMPEVIFGGLRPPNWKENDHKSFTIGGGIQVATTRYKSSNHNLILDGKFIF